MNFAKTNAVDTGIFDMNILADGTSTIRIDTEVDDIADSEAYNINVIISPLSSEN